MEEHKHAFVSESLQPTWYKETHTATLGTPPHSLSQTKDDSWEIYIYIRDKETAIEVTFGADVDSRAGPHDILLHTHTLAQYTPSCMDNDEAVYLQ